jgi:membrane-bound lytic murein transglycosylase D
LPQTEIAAAWGRLPPAQRFVAQRNDGRYKIRRGETLASIAAASGVSASRLLATNGWSGAHAVTRGEVIHIPLPASRAESSAGAPPEVAAASPASGAQSAGGAAPAATAAPPAAVQVARPPKEPVSQRQTDSNALLPVAAPTGNSDATDYSVGADNKVIVQPGETLGHFADWSGISSQALRALNKLHKNAMVTVGHKVKLDFTRVSAEQFAAARREYHHGLQEQYFAAHRIAGTENYSVKRGDSLWVIAEQHVDLPVWLVAQYNPDVDFNDMRPGTVITLPRVAPINRQ